VKFPRPLRRILNPWGVACAAAFLALACALCLPVRLPPLSRVASIVISDRAGTALREVFSPASGRGTMVAADQVSPEYLAALIAIEDKRFSLHHGVDPLAVLHAVYENVRARGVVRGGSTITQQLVRTLHPRRRTLFAKLAEALEAVRLETHYGKKEILTQYINRISFGNNNFGVEAAARFYLGKSSKCLTFSEAAYLLSIPRNPTLHNPLVSGMGAQKKRHRHVLERLLAIQAVDSAGFKRALSQFPRLTEHHDVVKAPHFTNWILSQNAADAPIVRTTLDLPLQEAAEEAVGRWVGRCASYNVTNGSAIVVDSRCGDILAYVGSADFWDFEHDGEVDGVRSYRQPGSSIKPFTYALGLENGLTAASVLPDIPTHLPTPGGDFVPQNYDRSFHGPVRLRIALGCSYNVPAVRVASLVGVDNLLRFLRTCGFDGLTRPATDYGLGLTLGSGEATLLQLTRAYCLFPRRGAALALRWKLDGEEIGAAPPKPPSRLIPEAVAGIMADILADNDARAPAFGRQSVLVMPFPCAVKTGTTKDYKDNWAIGFAGRFAVGVWVGNFNGSPMHGVSGVSGAGPVFHELMMAVEKRFGPLDPPSPAEGIVRHRICPLSGERPGPWCEGSVEELFAWGSQPAGVCSYHGEKGVDYPPEYALWAGENAAPAPPPRTPSSDPGARLRIAFPDNASVFTIDPVLERAFQAVSISILAPKSVASVVVYVDAKKHAVITAPFECRWPLQKGEHTIRAASAADASVSDSVRIRVL
jgi:penicillin-binding protein 1C